MRRIKQTLAAVGIIAGVTMTSAQAEPMSLMVGGRIASQLPSVVHDAHYVWAGKGYCWHDGGWNGPGWYRCGYAARTGKGWGGPQGWHGWHWMGPKGPHHWGHHQGPHHQGRGCCW